MKRRRLYLAMSLCAALLALTAAKPRRASPDRIWIHPEIERLRPRRIAVLPAVSFVFLPKERGYLEDAWQQRMIGSRHEWMPAVICRERMASTSRRGDSLLTAIGNQIRSRGRVDSTSSPRLAQLLNSQALLCLRIDRWERMGTARSTQIYVDMTAALVDSNGRLLWRVVSEERLESVYGVPKFDDGLASSGSGPASRGHTPLAVEEPKTPGSAGQPGEVGGYERARARDEATEQRRMSRPGEMAMATESAWISADYQAALGRILARWSRLFPESPRRVSAAIAR
jgi:hypothetical protein